jgi:AcrR family transcriptional regulator
MWYSVTIDTSSAHHLAEGAPTRRRERLRQTTVAEIKVLAWRQIAEAGAPSLSLRAIARDMGMTSSALYRYFPSRDVLLTALIRDGFASLADALEAVEASIDSEGEGGRGSATSATSATTAGSAGSARLGTSAGSAGSAGTAGSAGSAGTAGSAGSGERFIRIVRAYRAWALSHPSEYALIFGTPVPGLEVHDLDVKEELIRGVNVLFRCMIAGVQRGAIRPPALQGPGAGKLRVKLRAWGMAEAPGLPPAALAGCLFAWTQLHGAISLELFGHMPEEVLPADELFEQQMRQVLVALGAVGARPA